MVEEEAEQCARGTELSQRKASYLSLESGIKEETWTEELLAAKLQAPHLIPASTGGPSGLAASGAPTVPSGEGGWSWGSIMTSWGITSLYTARRGNCPLHPRCQYTDKEDLRKGEEPTTWGRQTSLLQLRPSFRRSRFSFHGRQ